MVDFGSDLRKRTLVLCAALALAIAGSVLLRGRRRVNVLFAAFAGDMALWYLAQSLYGFFQASIWARVTALLSILLPQFAVHLFEAILPPPEGERSRLGRIGAMLAVPVILLVLSPYHGSGWARGLVFLYVGGLMVPALQLLARRGRTSPSRATQGRVRYLVGVGALATAFSLVDFIWFLGVELPPVGTVLSVIFLFALAQSLGHAGETRHPDVVAAVDDASRRIRAAGKPVREDFVTVGWINDIIMRGAEATFGPARNAATGGAQV